MDALRTLTSALGHYDPDAGDNSPQANTRKAVRLTAQLGTLVATIGRLNAGGGPIQPDPVLSHAANFLYMLTGERPSSLATRAFDVALVLHADHELNASTFAARVAAATLTDIHSTIVGAIGALKGPLHGGANADVMRLLLEIRPDCRAGEGRRRDPGEAGAQGKDSRASAIACTTPRIRERRTCGRCRASSASGPDSPSWFEMSAAHRSAREGREEAQSERGFLLGVHLLLAGHPRRSLHADLRREPRSRAGRRTCSSSTRTIASSARARNTSVRNTRNATVRSSNGSPLGNRCRTRRTTNTRDLSPVSLLLRDVRDAQRCCDTKAVGGGPPFTLASLRPLLRAPSRRLRQVRRTPSRSACSR